MSDLLIRNVPDEVVAAIDARAERLGLSRTEYLRRRIAEDAERSSGTVTVDHLQRFGALVADLGDREVMAGAWPRPN